MADYEHLREVHETKQSYARQAKNKSYGKGANKVGKKAVKQIEEYLRNLK